MTSHLNSEMETEMEITPLLTIERATQALGGISRSKIYELLRSGELGSVKIGSRRLIPATAIYEFIQGLKRKAVSNDVD